MRKGVKRLVEKITLGLFSDDKAGMNKIENCMYTYKKMKLCDMKIDEFFLRNELRV